MGDTLSSESRNLSLVDELKDYFLHQIGLFVQQMGLSFCFSLLNQVSVGSPWTHPCQGGIKAGFQVSFAAAYQVIKVFPL